MDLLANTDKKILLRELIIEVDKNGIILYITPNCYHILGYTCDEMLNTNISLYLKHNFNDLSQIKNFNTEILGKDGISRFFDVNVTQIITNNKVEGVHFSLIDISKYNELENREKMLLRMLEHAKDLICRLELIPEPRFTYLSSSVQDFFGYTLEDCMKNPMLPFEIVHPDDREMQFSKIKGDTDFSNAFQVRMKHKNGYYVWIEDYVIPEYDENNQLVAVESITRNVQDRKELELRLERLGYTDNLTGLSNKNYFLKEMNLLNTEINIPVGIIVCDLDNLKFTNDSLGHSKGDNLIKSAAIVLQSVFKSEHVISRTGGDEFVVIVKNKSSLEFRNLFTEFQEAIKTFNNKHKNIPVEMSIGLSYTETSISKMQSTLDSADSEMYRNKKFKNQKYKRLPHNA